MIYFKINLEDIERIINETEKSNGPIIEEIVLKGEDESLKKAKRIINEFWGKIKTNLRRIIIHGESKEVLDEILNDINLGYQKVKEDIDDKHINMLEMISKRVSRLWEKTFQMAISSLPSSLRGGSKTFSVKTYSIGLTIKLKFDS